MSKIPATSARILEELRAILHDPAAELSEHWIVPLTEMEATRLGRNWTYDAPRIPVYLRTRLAAAVEFLGARFVLAPS